ncbi:DNA-3-methyladenine glycosylase 2 family protein [Sutcliffiella horikoshii]|uniref:DNA-3-methyladenine glycosylase II n=1 Tax=Sutcliffiella horikoshii TaxID=79883 RepID=A0AA94WQM5_9BACI|nr:DNA-3-methyladenine glycosylase [Sutcliffiella horikoshii]TYS58716.1 DNA-3-methyladenine glycosylase 2 family protein [Sutcliffiella horikoshii]
MVKIKINGPYDFDRVLQRLSIDPLMAIHSTERFVKVPMYQEKTPIVVKVQATGTKQNPSFELSSSATLTEKEIQHIKAIFQWDKPLQAISNHFAKTDLATIFQEHEGTPLVLDFDLYHCLMKCIIHQQVNMKFAHTLTERFVHTFGFEKEGVWFYPKPADVAKLDYEQITALKMSRRKAEYIIDTSKLIATGDLPLYSLDNMSDEEILKMLIKVRGIGPWTVQNLLLFGLGRPNLFPIADIGIQNALKKLKGLDQKPTVLQMQEWAKDWEPYLSYASLYLWRSIEPQVEELVK